LENNESPEAKSGKQASGLYVRDIPLTAKKKRTNPKIMLFVEAGGILAPLQTAARLCPSLVLKQDSGGKPGGPC